MSSLFVPSNVESGPGSIERLGELAKKLGITKPLVVIDPNLVNGSSSVGTRVEEILKLNMMEAIVFSNFSGEPTTSHVLEAVQLHDAHKYDGVVAIGGGSSIDIGKAVALSVVEPHLPWSDIYKREKLSRLPLIAIPTTSGTGSEGTKVMVIANSETNVKMNPGHPGLVPDIAVLDPSLTFSMPKSVTIFTGLDALTHAMEAYVSRFAQPMTDLFALDAIRLIHANLPIVVEEPENVQAREAMQIASFLAGIAFSNSSTNLAHAMGRPLGARFHVPHGLSVAITLPYVVRFGASRVAKRYSIIAESLGASKASVSAEDCIEKLEQFWELFDVWSLARRFISPDELEAAVQTLTTDTLSGNGIESNLRVPTYDDVAMLFNAIVEKLRSRELVRSEER